MTSVKMSVDVLGKAEKKVGIVECAIVEMSLVTGHDLLGEKVKVKGAWTRVRLAGDQGAVLRRSRR